MHLTSMLTRLARGDLNGWSPPAPLPPRIIQHPTEVDDGIGHAGNR